MELFLNDARGIFIPQNWAEIIKRDCVEGVSEEDYAILLKGPNEEDSLYWETWDCVLQNAKVTVPDTGRKGCFYQNGDLWLIYDDEEVPEDFFC